MLRGTLRHTGGAVLNAALVGATANAEVALSFDAWYLHINI